MKFYRKENDQRSAPSEMAANEMIVNKMIPKEEIRTFEEANQGSPEGEIEIILDGKGKDDEEEKESISTNGRKALIVENTEIVPELAAIYKSEGRAIDIFPFCVTVGIFLLVIIFSFMIGTKKTSSLIGLELCSVSYWFFLIGFLLVMLCINIATGLYLYKRHILKEQLGYEYDEHDLVWSPRNIKIISTVGLISGLGAGLLGIGGGVIMGPVMLMLNVRPEVSAATSSFMVAFTSSTAILQYASSGRINVAYAFWFIGIAVIGSLIGIYVLRRLSEKYQRPSVLVFALWVIMIVATLLVPFYGITKMIKDENDDKASYEFSSYC